jgi:hypothetical protein
VLVTGRTRPLSQYRSDVSGVAPALFLPGVLTSLMPGGGSSTAAFETIPGDVSSVASPIMNLAGDAHETFAGLANWGDESQKSVYTVRVVYGAESRGFFQPLGGIRVQEFSSILSHPYLIARTDDTREFERLVGSPTEACRDQAHVFGLWFLPSGAAGNSVSSTPGIGGALNAVGGALDLAKCGLGIIGAGGAALDSAIGSDLGFQLPFGTLKEYPELHRVAP